MRRISLSIVELRFRVNFDLERTETKMLETKSKYNRNDKQIHCLKCGGRG